MNTNEEIPLQSNNAFYGKFIAAKTKLMQCHMDNNLSSCLKCPRLFSCNIREEYVNATFENMNQGKEGTFDFN